MGLPLSAATLAAYRRLNEALWERYRRGEVASETVAVERFRQLLVHLGADPRQAGGLALAYLDQLSKRGDLLPGCRAALARLGRRYRLGIVTNGYERVQRSRLAAARLTPLFEVVVTSEACGFAKPDPRILFTALEALGVRADEALYVGDDPRTDGAAAAAAGVPFCWMDCGGPLPPGVRRPRRRVESLTALADAL
jgi:HAD superfamily hydrolase (TIGR01549 family)